MLIGKKVDVILAGHDHIYARTHQVQYDDARGVTVADSDGSYAAGAGSVQVIVGNGGHNARALVSPVAGVWAAGAPGSTTGWLRLDVTEDSIRARHVTVAGSLTDEWAITR